MVNFSEDTEWILNQANPRKLFKHQQCQLTQLCIIKDKIHKTRDLMGLEEGTLGCRQPIASHRGPLRWTEARIFYLTVFGQSFGAVGIAPAIAESVIFSLGSAGSPSTF